MELNSCEAFPHTCGGTLAVHRCIMQFSANSVVSSMSLSIIMISVATGMFTNVGCHKETLHALDLPAFPTVFFHVGLKALYFIKGSEIRSQPARRQALDPSSPLREGSLRKQ